jgi:hypothetical protein
MAISKTDGISAGVSVTATAIGFLIGGRMAAFAVGALGIMIALYFHDVHNDKSQIVELSISDEWKILADKFGTFQRMHVRAEWYSETLDNDGKPFGEQWMIRDGRKHKFASDCEALCKLAGAMLLKSPKTSMQL